MFCSRSLTSTPCVPFFTRKPSVRPSSDAYAIIHSASAAYGTLHFTPLRTKSPLDRAAIVFKAALSKLYRGSMSAAEAGEYASEQNCGRSSALCCSLPHSSTGKATRFGADNASAPDRSPHASSSAASTPVTAERSPKPPYCSGMLAGNRPSSQPPAKTDAPSSPCSSASRARSRSSLEANLRAPSMNICCSSEGSNENITILHDLVCPCRRPLCGRRRTTPM